MQINRDWKSLGVNVDIETQSMCIPMENQMPHEEQDALFVSC